MVYLYFRHRHRQPKPEGRFPELPRVTVQLPLYTSSTSWSRLQIQVLEDSTDETTTVVSQYEIYPDWKGRLRFLPMLLSLGIGTCLNNGRAVLEALLGCETEFVRTPKYGIESSDDEWRHRRVRGALLDHEREVQHVLQELPGAHARRAGTELVVLRPQTSVAQ